MHQASFPESEDGKEQMHKLKDRQVDQAKDNPFRKADLTERCIEGCGRVREIFERHL